jgi:zinc transport system permease protein
VPEIFQHAYMVRALIGGVLVAILASYYGPFVVQRRLAFLGSGLAHAAFGGVALGLLLNTQPLWIATPFTVVVALAIVWVREHAELEADTAIGIFFSVSMALGVIFLSMKQQYTADAFTYLFGSILSVTAGDLWVTGGVVALSLMMWPLWSRWAYATFDRTLARSDRLAVTRDDYLLSVAIAVSVVVSIKVVGILLISACLVLPAATARLVSQTFRQMTLISLVIGISTIIAGLLASYYLDQPSGPAIIITQSVLFGIVLAAKRK